MIDEYELKTIHEIGKSSKTGTYITFENKLRERILELRQLLSPNCKLIYSAKANYSPEVLNTFANIVDGFDVCTPGIMNNIQQTEKLINLTGPLKLSFAKEYIPKNYVYSIDSIGEIKKLMEGNKEKINIVTRIKTSEKSHFGLLEEELSEIVNYSDRINLLGYHMYFGSQIHDLGTIKNNLKTFSNFRKRYTEIFSLDPKYCIFAPGLGVKNFENEVDTPLNKVADLFKNVSNDFTIYLELGRFLVSESTFFVAKVINTREYMGKKIITLNGGISQYFYAASISRLIKGNHTIGVCSDGKMLPKKVHKIVGPSCYENDILADNISLPEINVGDVVYFKNAGAYGISFSPVNFLLLDKPNECFIKHKI